MFKKKKQIEKELKELQEKFLQKEREADRLTKLCGEVFCNEQR